MLMSFLLAPLLAIYKVLTASRAVEKLGGFERGISLEEALKLEYPYRRLFMTREQLNHAFSLVKKYEWSLTRVDYKILNMPELDDTQLEFTQRDGGGKTLCVMDPRDYHTMNWMSDWFNEKGRLACKRYDEKYTPLEYWARFKEQIYHNVSADTKGTPTLQKLNDAVYAKIIGCNNFRPGLMAGAIKYFGAKSVLDFSAGWGDRLIGAISQDVRYVGVDPNPCVHVGYKDIISTFARDPSKYTLIQSPFQTTKLPERDDGQLETYDLVFTSPPYFNLEIYSTDANQSVSEFSELETWFTNFLLVSLKKAWDVLNACGHMVIIINNIRGKPDFVMRMVSEVSTWEHAEYLGVLSYADKINEGGSDIKYKSPQPMWIWKKQPMDH